jgi:AcrR family transcriptional regulator
MEKGAGVNQKAREGARKLRNDFYRQRILDVAQQVFAERGFEAAKVQEISARAGLSMGTIYAIFPGKEDLFRAILEACGQEMLQLAREVTARGAAPRESLASLSEAYIGYFLDHPDFLRMHLREGTSWVLGPSSDSDSRAQLWREIHKLQAEILRRGVATGDFVDEDPAFLAKLFSAMDQVVLSEWVSRGMKADRTELLTRLNSLIVRTFCPPVSTRGSRGHSRSPRTSR